MAGTVTGNLTLSLGHHRTPCPFHPLLCVPARGSLPGPGQTSGVRPSATSAAQFQASDRASCLLPSFLYFYFFIIRDVTNLNRVKRAIRLLCMPYSRYYMCIIYIISYMYLRRVRIYIYALVNGHEKKFGYYIYKSKGSRGLFFRTANGSLGFATRITVGTMKNLRPISWNTRLTVFF